MALFVLSFRLRRQISHCMLDVLVDQLVFAQHQIKKRDFKKIKWHRAAFKMLLRRLAIQKSRKNTTHKDVAMSRNPGVVRYPVDAVANRSNHMKPWQHLISKKAPPGVDV